MIGLVDFSMLLTALMVVLLVMNDHVVAGIVILLSLRQRKLISQTADTLPPSQRGDFIEGVAARLSKCFRYCHR
jgi:hypothetical protein